jgi:hypothetical protein
LRRRWRLSESIADLNEEARGLAEGQRAWLNRAWLLFEMIRRDQQRNVAQFHEAEQMLYAAGVPRNWKG